MTFEKVVPEFVRDGEPLKSDALNIGRVEDRHFVADEQDAAADANLVRLLGAKVDLLVPRDLERINREALVA
jgi:hypothetical protein